MILKLMKVVSYSLLLLSCVQYSKNHLNNNSCNDPNGDSIPWVSKLVYIVQLDSRTFSCEVVRFLEGGDVKVSGNFIFNLKPLHKSDFSLYNECR